MPAELWPDFALIGAAKCGTTALAQMLGEHPELFITDPKEPGYFAGLPLFTRETYQQLYADAGSRLKGEASVHYSSRDAFPGTCERLHTTCPDLKILYVIREPFARVRSHFEYRLRHGRAEGRLDDLLAQNDELVSVSRYAYQLEPYIERFGRDRIHILRQEDLKTNQEAVLADIFAFLGVGAHAVGKVHANARPSSGSRRPVAIPGWARKLGRLVSPQMRRRLKRRLPTRKVDGGEVELSDATRERLKAVFTEDMARLRLLVGPEMDLYGYA